MKLISAILGALAVAAVSFVGTAQAQGYYAAPGYSQGGAISLGTLVVPTNARASQVEDPFSVLFS